MPTTHIASDPLAQLVSLGGRGSPCALGFVQRAAGHDRETLFRWADQTEHDLLGALRADLDGVGARGQVIVGPREGSAEWWARDPRHGFVIRGFVATAAVPLHIQTPRMRRRIAFLRDEFLRNLALARPICVYSAAIPLAPATVLHDLSQELRRLGARGLVYVRPADETFAHGASRMEASGLWIAALAPNAGVEAWRDLAERIDAWTDPITTTVKEPSIGALAPSANSWLEPIETALRDGQTEDARGLAENALGDANLGGHGYARLADLFTRMGNVAGAEGALRRAIGADPVSARFQDLLAQLLINAQRWDEAIDAKARADTLEPGSVSRMTILGALLTRADRLTEATVVLRQARMMAPKDSSVAKALSSLQLRQGKGVETLPVLRANAERDPNQPAHHARLANALLRAGHLAEAEAAQRRAVELDGENASYRVGLSILLHRRGEGEAALITARDAVLLPGADARAFGQLGRMAALAEQWEEAVEALERASATDPDWDNHAARARLRLERRGESDLS